MSFLDTSVADGMIFKALLHIVACALSNQWDGKDGDGKEAAQKCDKPGHVLPFHMDRTTHRENESHKGHCGGFWDGVRWLEMRFSCTCEMLCLTQPHTTAQPNRLPNRLCFEAVCLLLGLGSLE